MASHCRMLLARNSCLHNSVLSYWNNAVRGMSAGGDHTDSTTNPITGAPEVSSNMQSSEDMGSTPDTARKTEVLSEASMNEIRARVFGYHIGNGLRSGRKVLRKKLVGDMIASYYIEPIKDPLMLNLKQEAARVKLANLRRRGKGPPKKGQGKRSKK